MAQVLVGALIAGFFGVVATLGARRTEHARWLRAEQLKAWAAIASVAGRAALLDHVEPGPEAELRVRSEVLEALELALLLTPDDLRTKAVELSLSCNLLLGEPDDAKRATYREQVNKSLGTFSAAVRTQLGVKG